MKHFIFDFNGVIVNDEEIHFKAFKKTISEIYNLDLSFDCYSNFFAGKTDEYGFKLFTDHNNLVINYDELKCCKNNHYFELITMHDIPVISDIIEFIDYVKTDSILSLVTGSNKNEVDFILKRIGIYHYFTHKIYAEDVLHSKPHPEGYLKALSYAELAIENTFVIEDSPSGVMAAKQAGIFCIAIASTHSEQDLYLADLILSNYSAEALLTSISLIESN